MGFNPLSKSEEEINKSMKAVAGTPAILHNKIAVALFIVSHTNYRHTMIIGGFKTFKLTLAHFLSNFF